MKKPQEFSKKIMIFTGVVFSVSLIYCMVFYVIAMLTTQCIEWTPVVSILPVTGGMFGTATGFYYTKAQRENNIKLRKNVIEYKYSLLKQLHVLNHDTAIQDIMSDFSQIDTDFVNAETEDSYTNYKGESL